MKRFKNFIKEDRGEKAYKQAIDMGLKYGGFGYWKNDQGETVYKTENDTLVPVEPDEESELADKKGGKAKGGERGQLPDEMGGGGPAGASGLERLKGGENPDDKAGQGVLGTGMPGQAQARPLRSWNPGPDGDTCVGPDSQQPGKVPEDSYVGRTNYIKWGAGPNGDNMNTMSAERLMGEAMEMNNRTQPQANTKPNTTQSRVDTHNKEIQSKVSNPNYDLNQDGKKLGAGSYGSVRMSKEKHDGKDVVIKEGEIFDNEINTMKHFEDDDRFPTLVNAEVNRPWRENAGQKRADGRVAMTAVGDMELDDAFKKGGVEDNGDAAKKLMGLKKKLHTEGFYHGDLHDGNVRWDSKTQQPGLIDFGKAKKNINGALMEALAARNPRRDPVQAEGHINPWNQGVKGTTGTRAQMEMNFDRVRDRATEMAGIDAEKQPKAMKNLDSFLEGGNPDILEDQIEEDKEDFPFLRDEKNVRELIDIFYSGFGDDPEPEEESMSAMDKAQMDYKNRGYLGKPDLDMSPGQEGAKMLGEGIAGSAMLSPDKQSVIKSGEIYKNELDALHALKDNPNMPNIHNVEFDEEFYESSSGKEKAAGRMGMSLAPGQEVGKLLNELDEDQLGEMARANWNTRADMHRAGVSHGDMHEENVFYDPQSKQSTFIDFGMGFDSPITALSEAYKGITPGPLSEMMPGTTADVSFTGHSPVPDDYAKTFKNNKSKVLNAMKSDGIKGHKKLLESLIDAPSNYKIKQNDENMMALTEQFGGDENIMNYINLLYEGIGGPQQPEVSPEAQNSVKPKLSMKERMAAAASKQGFDHDD